MKPIYGQFAAACALTFGLAACIPPAPEPTPAPSPAPVVTPTPTPAPVVQPRPDNWMDARQTPGNWSYGAASGGTMAQYSSGNSPVFALMCNATSRQISLTRLGSAASTGQMNIRTETSERALPVQRGATANALSATLQPRDPLLDAMALTKGRFAVETAGSAPLYLPAWAEVTRVIEDCR